jgi:hypothetical protein
VQHDAGRVHDATQPRRALALDREVETPDGFGQQRLARDIAHGL